MAKATQNYCLHRQLCLCRGALFNNLVYTFHAEIGQYKGCSFRSVLHWQQGAFQSNLYVHCKIIHCQQRGCCFLLQRSKFCYKVYWCMITAAKCIYVSHSAMYDFVITGVVIESVPVGQISRSLDFVARICCDVVVDPIATQRRDKVNLLSEEDICDIFRPHHSIMDVKFFY